MEETTIWTGGVFDVRARPRTVWIGVCRSPSADEIERLTAVLLPWLQVASETGDSFVLHVEDSAADDMTPLELPQLLCLVAKLMEHRELIDRALFGTVIQVRKLDDAAVFAKDLFLGLYTPSKPFDLVRTPEEVARFFKSLK